MSWNTRLDRLAQGCALLVAVCLLSATAHAQPKPALVKDANEPGLNPYVESVQVDQDATACQPSAPDFSSCVYILSTVPAGRRRVITHVSASFFLTPGGTFPEVFIGSTGGGYVQLPLQPVQSGTAIDRHLVSTPVTFYVEPGDAPRFTLRGFFLVDGRLATLSLSGYDVNLP